MAVEVTIGTPLADALQSVVQPKLVEVGWSSGGPDDSALSEYILLMLVNGKTQDQIASELSNDLLGLGPEDSGASDFAHWLFEQVEVLHRQLNGAVQTGNSTSLATQAMSTSGAGSAQTNQATDANVTSKAIDTEMGDTAEDSQNVIPTGPKAMRNGNQKTKDKRMLGQLNKAMDRGGDAALHRVRASAGTGRINSHSREPPKGPRSQVGRNLAAMSNGRPAPGLQMPQMLQNGTVPPFMNINMTPQQQMQLLAFYEEQARVMQQIFSGQGVAPPFVNPNFQFGNQQQQSGKSLFDRVQNRPPRQNGTSGTKRPSASLNPSLGKDVVMDDGLDNAASVDNLTSSREDENSHSANSSEPSQIECAFNLRCAKPDCPYAHQSPAAPPGTVIDMTDVCSFGAACKNYKCVGRHPSPAKRASHQAEQDCKYWPNCKNGPACPFRHPNMPICKNGADCKTPDCKFTHVKTQCKFNPCLNAHCPYKHAEGQKRGSFEDKVWTQGEEKRDHVSERKFVQEDGEEELIIPGSGTKETQIVL